MGERLDVGLFGVIHTDRTAKVRTELDRFVADTEADAIFIEYPCDPGGLRLLLRLFLRVPIYLLGAGLLQLVAYTPLYLLFVRDLYPAEMVAALAVSEDQNLDVHRVDEHPNQQVKDAGLGWVALNWAVLLSVFLLATPIAVAVTAGLALVGGIVPPLVRRGGYRWSAVALGLAGLLAAVVTLTVGLFSTALLGVAVVGFFAVVFVTVADRNDVMLDRLQRIASADGHDDAVMVTGKAHLAGARERGMAVPAIHVSEWLRAGTTYADPDAATLPRVDASFVSEKPGGTVPRDGQSVLGKRALAAGFDLVLSAALAGLATSVTSAVANRYGLLGAARGPVFAAVFVGALFCYFAGFEAKLGRTPGKGRFGLAVIHTDGRPVSAGAALLRNLLRPVDFLLGYAVGVLCILLSKNRQRLGDFAAETTVGSADTS